MMLLEVSCLPSTIVFPSSPSSHMSSRQRVLVSGGYKNVLLIQLRTEKVSWECRFPDNMAPLQNFTIQALKSMPLP